MCVFECVLRDVIMVQMRRRGERDAGGVRAGPEGDEDGAAHPSGPARVRPLRQQPRRHRGHAGDPLRAVQPQELPRRRRPPALLPGTSTTQK